MIPASRLELPEQRDEIYPQNLPGTIRSHWQHQQKFLFSVPNAQIASHNRNNFTGSNSSVLLKYFRQISSSLALHTSTINYHDNSFTHRVPHSRCTWLAPHTLQGLCCVIQKLHRVNNIFFISNISFFFSFCLFLIKFRRERSFRSSG